MNAIRTLAAAGVLLPAVLAGSVAWAQQPAPAQKQPAAQQEPRDESTAESIRHYTVARREQATAAAKRATTTIDQQIEALQAQVDERWSRMSETSRARTRATMEDLRRRRTDAAEWYGGMRHGSTSAWVEVRNGFAKSYRDLADAMQKARTQFKEKSDASKPSEEQAPKSSH